MTFFKIGCKGTKKIAYMQIFEERKCKIFAYIKNLL